jgi:hypothetical protein
MKLSGKMLLGLALVTAQTVTAITVNPYQGIVERNVFSLKPAPPPPSVDPPKPPASKIILTGITTILGMKQALMKTAATAGKPGEAKGEQSYILTEGQREGDIEVMEIDEKAGTVKVTQDGTVFVLNFDKDGQKPTAGAPGVPPPVIPPPTGFGAPAGIPAPQPATMPKFNMPVRPLRTGAAGTAANTGGFGNPGMSGTPGGFGSPYSGGVQGQQPAAQLTPEASALLIEAERERLQQSGSPLANLMPITRATPAGAPGSVQAPSTGPETPTPQQPAFPPTFPGRNIPPPPAPQ